MTNGHKEHPVTNNTDHDSKVLLEQLVKLTESIQRLAQDSENAKRNEDALRRQRVDFGYRVLGALMGRSKNKGFDIKVIDARWDNNRKHVELFRLPDAATLVELRSGETTEMLYIDRSDPKGPKSGSKGQKTSEGEQPAAETGAGDGRRSPRRTPPNGRVTPTTITSDREIDSVLVLDDPDGPPIAIGPRIKPPQRYQQA